MNIKVFCKGVMLKYVADRLIMAKVTIICSIKYRMPPRERKKIWQGDEENRF